MGVNTVLWPSKNISATCGVLCIVRWRTSELIIYDCKAFTVQDNVPVDKQYTVGLKNDEKSLQRFGDKGKAFEKGENGPTGAGWQVSCVGLIDFLFVVSVLAWPSYWNLYNCKLLRIMKKDSYRLRFKNHSLPNNDSKLYKHIAKTSCGTLLRNTEHSLLTNPNFSRANNCYPMYKSLFSE